MHSARIQDNNARIQDKSARIQDKMLIQKSGFYGGIWKIQSMHHPHISLLHLFLVRPLSAPPLLSVDASERAKTILALAVSRESFREGTSETRCTATHST